MRLLHDEPGESRVVHLRPIFYDQLLECPLLRACHLEVLRLLLAKSDMRQAVFVIYVRPRLALLHLPLDH